VTPKMFSTEAIQFLEQLHRRFNDRRLHLLHLRKVRANELKQGKELQFLSETKKIRETSWSVAPAPADLSDRRVEITGPAEAKMIINALNSNAKVFMADFEDSLAPTWSNLLDGQTALYQAVRKTLEFKNESGKLYRLNQKTATLVVRPRGLHLDEENYQIDAEFSSGSLFDFGLFFFHNAHELLKRGSGPYFYLPKMESHLEARWWNDVFDFAQDFLKIPRGTIRATCLIETINAAFEMDEILYELRTHASGLNAGRWDYIFSFIKKLHFSSNAILPDRAQVTMTTPFMNAYCELLVQTCHRRGAHAMGGMSAFIPNRKQPEVTALALEKVCEDKAREAKMGFDGTWVAHPDLIAVAAAEFDQVLKSLPHQKSVIPQVEISAGDLLNPRIENATITEAGVRSNLNVALVYIEKWMGGLGAVAHNNLMEDAATAEISRSQLWQWLHRGITLADGRVFSEELFQKMLDEEIAKIPLAEAPYIKLAAGLLNDLILTNQFPEFLTLRAYETLNQIHHKESFMTHTTEATSSQLEYAWGHDPRWQGIERNYSPADVLKLRTTMPVQHTIAAFGARKLWKMLHEESFTRTFGAMTGAQAVQMVKAGLKAVYLSGWQVAADANLAGQTYPDQSLYPSNSVPAVVKRINNAFQRADQIERAAGHTGRGHDWYAPIIADAEAGFGGPLHAFELMKSMIEAGASGVHFEDQLAAEKKCGHLAGKVLVPTCNFVRTLQAARLAADVLDVPTVIIARTDALSANLMTSDIDPADKKFLTGERTTEGYYHIKGGLDYAISRGLAYAQWADVLWFETSKPDMAEAEKFAKEIHAKYPGKVLAYNCSPSFNWKMHLSDEEIAQFQIRLGAMGYKFQFITLAGWHLLNYHTFDLAQAYAKDGMTAYVNLQEQEFKGAKHGYTAVRHQQEVGTGYFDHVLQTVAEGKASTGALAGSTEEQFHGHAPATATASSKSSTVVAH
jgi:malate synthase A